MHNNFASRDPLPEQSATSSRFAYIKPSFFVQETGQIKYLASSYISWLLFVRGFPRFLPFRKAERRLLLKEAHLAASQRGEAAKNEGLKALQAQLSEVLFELDRRAAKLLLKRLGSRFLEVEVLMYYDVLCLSINTHIFRQRHMIFMKYIVSPGDFCGSECSEDPVNTCKFNHNI